jgi:hypothetical protein
LIPPPFFGCRDGAAAERIFGSIRAVLEATKAPHARVQFVSLAA